MKRLAAIALALSAVCLVVPAAALASAGAAKTTLLVHLGMHDGYRVTMEATDSTAFLDVATPTGRQDAVTATRYYTRAALAGGALKADFGALGHVAIHFVPGGSRPTRICLASKRSFIRHGTFIGTFRFRGESDYVNFDLRRARGISIASLPGSRCETAETSSQGNGGTRQKLVKFYARFRQGIDASYFWAETTRTGRVSYEAQVLEGGEQFGVSHDAFVEASPLTFATDHALSFLSISPPYPFGGSGLVQRKANGSRAWSGSLDVSFPGDPDVPLTGPQFQTFLARQW